MDLPGELAETPGCATGRRPRSEGRRRVRRLEGVCSPRLSEPNGAPTSSPGRLIIEEVTQSVAAAGSGRRPGDGGAASARPPGARPETWRSSTFGSRSSRARAPMRAWGRCGTRRTPGCAASVVGPWRRYAVRERRARAGRPYETERSRRRARDARTLASEMTTPARQIELRSRHLDSLA